MGVKENNRQFGMAIDALLKADRIAVKIRREIKKPCSLPETAEKLRKWQGAHNFHLAEAGKRFEAYTVGFAETIVKKLT